MQRVIVTVKRQDEARVRDLEVPAEVEAGRLAEMIACALRWESDPAGQPIQYEIMAEPPGRILGAQESLAEAGAWDGAWLVLQPLGKEPSAPLPPSPPEPVVPPIYNGGPVVGRRPLDLPTGAEPEQEETSEEVGFVWKQVD